jgi:hypothetical protein
MFEALGVAGIAISMLAYLPQVAHLAREHCSAGVSRRAWAMWLASSLLVGALAVHRRDLVFILLQLSSLTSAAVILSLASRYRGMVCETHALHDSRSRVGGDDMPPRPAGAWPGGALAPVSVLGLSSFAWSVAATLAAWVAVRGARWTAARDGRDSERSRKSTRKAG